MASDTLPSILLCASATAAADELAACLSQAGFELVRQPLGSQQPAANLSSFCVVVLDGGSNLEQTARYCRHIRFHLGEAFVPVLVILPDQMTADRHLAFEAGVHACLSRPFTPRELVAQVQALARIKQISDHFLYKSREADLFNERLQQAHGRVTEELELARRIQLSFLPQVLPEMPRASLAVHYRPCGRVGGDFYDAFRLDENHVGFYVADAMGHGVPASLLTMFLKKGVRAKEIFGNQYRLVPPNEVLERLNHDLIEHRLSENPFITMVYAVFDDQQRTLQFARAGHPHPLHVPVDRDPEHLEVPGSLLGVFETNFPVRTCQLQPGEKILLYTDGTDAVSYESQLPGTASLAACAARYRDLPIGPFVEKLAQELCRQSDLPDDFTMLGLELKV